MCTRGAGHGGCGHGDHDDAGETRGEAEQHAAILWVMADLLGDPVGGGMSAPQLR